MGKRLVLKTIIICTGLFLMISAISLYTLFNKYKLDTQRDYKVLIATTDIEDGTVLNESMIAYKQIKESALNKYMSLNVDDVVGKKAINEVKQGDYLRAYSLISKDNWYKDDDRTIVLETEVLDRMANLIGKGAYIDFVLFPSNIKNPPVTVLSKIKVQDVLDENGISLGNKGVNKKAYVKVILGREQRERFYAASSLGKIKYELYCDSLQRPAAEEFIIPEEYFTSYKLQGENHGVYNKETGKSN